MINRLGLIAVILFGCSRAPASVRDSTVVARDPNRVTVDSARRERFKIARVDSVRFTPIISTTGTVAFSADRSTHLKIVVVALVAGIAVAGFGITAARTGSDEGLTQTARVIKAGKPVVITSSNATLVR